MLNQVKSVATKFLGGGKNNNINVNTNLPDDEEFYDAERLSGETDNSIPNLSDILSIPPESHFEKIAWGGVSHSSNIKVFTNRDKTEYIKVKSIQNKTIISCQFVIQNDHDIKTFYKFHGSDYILSSRDGSFIAKFDVTSNLNLSAGNFTEKRRLFLKNMRVVEVLKDGLVAQRNSLYKDFLSHMSTNNIFKDSSHGNEFLFQISKLVNENRKLDNIKILSDLYKNKHVPERIKIITHELLKLEEDLSSRQLNFPNFVSSEYNKNIFLDVKNILGSILDNHIKSLFSHLTAYGPQLFHQIVEDLNRISDYKYLYIFENDIRLFSDLILLCTQQHCETFQIYILQYLSLVWKDFIEKVNSINHKNISSLKDIGPLTDPVYHSLFKSFLEILNEISTITNKSKMDILKVVDSKSLKIKTKITWPENSSMTHSLEKQFGTVLELLHHFRPGQYSIYKPYAHILKDKLSMHESNKVFVYLLTDVLNSVFEYEKSQQSKAVIADTFVSFQSDLLDSYTNLVKSATVNQFETFRVAAHSIIKFTAQICPYIFNLGSENSDDVIILKKQMGYMSVLLLSSVDEMSIKYFTTLLDTYIVYWEKRQSVISNLCNEVGDHFHPDIKKIISEIFLIVKAALEKEGSLQSLITFFQNLNEFLHHLNSVDFSWIVKVHTGIPSSWYEITNQDKKSAKIIQPSDFLQTCNRNNWEIPKNYVVIILQTLLKSVFFFLHTNKWSKDTIVSATSDLILAVGHSFIYLREHSQYEDFEQFLDDSTKPFENLVQNYGTYDDFKKRINNISNFYIYTRKQNEINFTKAIKLFCEAANTVQKCGFECNFNKNLLESSFNVYQTNFEYVFNNFSDAESVITHLKNELIAIQATDQQIKNWTSSFKQCTVPKILAYLAAIWSINESKDIECTKRRLQPHCIQILCILRLLGADHTDKGIKNHLAQVLTGQGKSIVLGLLAALLAVMGYKVQLVCYSKYLADRDQKDFEKYFKQLGVRPNINYGTFEDMANQVLEPVVDGTEENLRSLVDKLIRNELSKRKSNEFTCSTTETILLIDEVDVFFSEDFYGNTYNPIQSVQMNMLSQIQIKIWESVTSGVYDANSIKERIHDFIRVTSITADSHHKDKVFDKFMANSKLFFERHLNLMIEQAINVNNGSEENWYINHFKINDDGLIACRKSCGLYSTSTYYTYYNVFNYFRLKKKEFETKGHNYGYLCVDCGNISYAMLPNEFKLILGVSGTLTDLSNSEKQAIKSYNIKEVSSMPSFFGRSNLSFNSACDFTLSQSIDTWLSKISDNAYKKVQAGVAVILFFESEANIELFRTKKERNFHSLHVLTGNENRHCDGRVGKQKSLDWLISIAGVAKTVTLATRVMGRGVDFKSNDSAVEEKGGVHVIQTFYSPDIKEEIQIKGRTARKDNKGSYELIICQEHLKCYEGFCSTVINTYEDMCSVRRLQADEQCSNNLEKVSKSQEKHTKTMQFMKSLLKFSLDERSTYLSSYPINGDN